MTNRDLLPRNSTLKLLTLVLACLFIAGGCRSYPEVTSAESQHFIKQVYTACNTKSIDRVSKCVERLNELTSQNLISKSEAAAFNRILELAKANDWQSAQDQALEFAQRQVR